MPVADREKAVAAAAAAQTYMRDALNLRVQARGHWGSYTHGLYTKLPISEKVAIDNIVAGYGLSVPDLRLAAVVSKNQVMSNADSEAGASALLGKRYFTVTMLMPSILMASRATGVGSDVIQKFLDLEAATIRIGGVTYYDAWAINSGGYRGLFQFDKAGAAWASARQSVPSLPPFSDAAWKNPDSSTLAAAGYILFNTDVVRRLGYKGPITGNVAYLMHNQGAHGALGVLRGARTIAGSQSDKAVMVAQAAIKDANLRA